MATQEPEPEECMEVAAVQMDECMHECANSDITIAFSDENSQGEVKSRCERRPQDGSFPKEKQGGPVESVSSGRTQAYEPYDSQLEFERDPKVWHREQCHSTLWNIQNMLDAEPYNAGEHTWDKLHPLLRQMESKIRLGGELRDEWIREMLERSTDIQAMQERRDWDDKCEQK